VALEGAPQPLAEEDAAKATEAKPESAPASAAEVVAELKH
jgi:hypothetical protein